MPYHNRFGVLGKWFHVDHGPSLRLLYIIQVCNDVAARLAVVFAPVFLYVQGNKADFQWGLLQGIFGGLNGAQKGIVLVALYFIIARLVVLVSSPSAGKVLARFGSAAALVLGHFSYAAALLALTFVERNGFAAVILAAITYGLHISFFWVTLFTVFAHEASGKSVGRDVSMVTFLVQLGTVIVPALAGLLAARFGFDIVFFVAVVIVGIGALASAMLHYEAPKQVLSWSVIRKMIMSPIMKSVSLSWIGKYANDAVLALWPVYVFVIIGNIEGVGYLQSLALFLSLLFVFFAGWTVDSKKYKQQFSLSAGVLSVIWLIRVGFAQVWGLVLTEVFERVAGSFHAVVFDSLFIKHAKSQKTLLYFVTREVVISTAAVIFWSLVLLLAVTVSNIWLFLFAAAAAGILLSMRVQSET